MAARPPRRAAFDHRFTAGFPTFVRRWGGVIFPKETGALAQAVVVLTTSAAVAGGRWPALCLAGACFAAFLAHEPFLIATGMRGGRARHDHGRRAWAQLLVAPALSLALLGAGLWGAPAGTAWLLVAPALPALALAPLVFGRLEKTAEGELLAAGTIAAFALPVARAGGVELAGAAALAAVYAAALLVATLAVRRVTAEALRATTRLRLTAPLATMAVAGGALVALAGAGVFPWLTAVAPLPVFAFSAWLTASPPHLRHVRKVGWTLAACLLATSVLVGAAVGGP